MKRKHIAACGNCEPIRLNTGNHFVNVYNKNPLCHVVCREAKFWMNFTVFITVYFSI